MSDLVKRLLEADIQAWLDAYSCRARGKEAAERIEALTAERDRLREALKELTDAAKLIFTDENGMTTFEAHPKAVDLWEVTTRSCAALKTEEDG